MKRFEKIYYFVIIATMSMTSINCFAYDIAVGGIYYNYINEGKELAVTYRTRPEHNEAAYSGYGSIDIPSEVTYAGRTREVTAIGDSAFYRTYRPDKITIPNSVKYIGMYAFWGCTCDLVFGNGVKSIGGDAFYSFGMSGDNKLSGVKVIINDIAAWCNISFGDSPLQWGAKLYYNDENTIIQGDIVIPDGTTSIGNWAFRNCPITSITLPNTVTSIGKEAFEGSSLTSITIPNSVTSIGYSAFNLCNSLNKVIVKDIAAWCNISFGDNPLSRAHHLYSDDNTEITNLVIPNSVTSIAGYAFDGCSGLTSVTIPNSVTSIGNYAFGYCSGLTSVTIPNSVTSIGREAFSYCSGLTSVTIGNSVTSIGNYAFQYCRGLTSVTIPNSVTSIGNSAFKNCSGLTSVTIPNSVTSIEKEAFNFTPNNLLEISCYIEEPTKATGSSFSSAIYNNATLYIPKGTMSKYKSTDGWKNFVFIEEGIPSGISSVRIEATEEERFNLRGEKLSVPQRGVNIIRMSDGTTKKVVVK